MMLKVEHTGLDTYVLVDSRELWDDLPEGTRLRIDDHELDVMYVYPMQLTRAIPVLAYKVTPGYHTFTLGKYSAELNVSYMGREIPWWVGIPRWRRPAFWILRKLSRRA